MHLCLLGPDWRTTGILRKEFVRDARSSGWDVTIVCGRDGEHFIPDFEALGVRCITVALERGSLNPFAVATLAWRLVIVLRNIRPDAVLAFTIVPLTIGLLAARLAHVRVRCALVTGAGYAFTSGGGAKRVALRLILTRLLQASFAGLALGIFQNPDDEALYRQLKAIGPRTRTVKVNGSGVDLLRFAEMPMKGGASFIMVCRFLREKGVLEFAQAAERVLSVRPDVSFLLVAPEDVNPGALRPADIEKWTALGVLHHVGFVEDVRPWLAGSNVFVLPSYREGTPRAALEALATGRPVITTDAPGCREVVIDNVTGYLVQPRSDVALAAAMLRIIETPERLIEMGKAARKDAENRFDVRKVNAAMLSEISSVVRARSDRN